MINKLMLSCRTATELIEKRQREEISRVERIQLSIHVALCAICRQYEKQSAWIDRIFQRKREVVSDQQINPDTLALEKKILRNLEDKE